MRKPLVILSGAVAILAAACAEGSGRPGAYYRIRDSAGVQLVHNVLPASEEWRLDSTPVAVISGGGDSTGVGDVAGLALLRDGRILLADRVGKSVRLFDTAGRLLGVAVKEGDGPDELRNISALFVSTHDTIFVHDASGGMLLVLDPEARPVRKIGQLEFRADSVRQVYSSASLVGVFDDGSIATREVPLVRDSLPAPADAASGDVSTAQRDYLRSEIVYRRGAPGDRVLAEFGSLMARGTAGDGPNKASHGREASAAFGDRFYFAPADTLGFSVYLNSGKLERVVTVDRPRALMPEPDSVPMGTRYTRTFMPDVLTLVSGADETIWVSSPTLLPSGNWSLIWYVFGTDGRLQATVGAGELFMIGAVRGDLVVGTSVTERGEPVVVLRRLLR